MEVRVKTGEVERMTGCEEEELSESEMSGLETNCGQV